VLNLLLLYCADCHMLYLPALLTGIGMIMHNTCSHCCNVVEYDSSTVKPTLSRTSGYCDE